jgi:hypothetical protein
VQTASTRFLLAAAPSKDQSKVTNQILVAPYSVDQYKTLAPHVVEQDMTLTSNQSDCNPAGGLRPGHRALLVPNLEPAAGMDRDP